MAFCQSCGISPWPPTSLVLLVRTVMPTTIKAFWSSIFAAEEAAEAAGGDAFCANPVAARARTRGKANFLVVGTVTGNIGEQYTQRWRRKTESQGLLPWGTLVRRNLPQRPLSLTHSLQAQARGFLRGARRARLR